MFGFKKKEPPQLPPRFPPVPKWQPSIAAPLDDIIERMAHYTNRQRDFAVFKHGTCAILPSGLAQDQAIALAKQMLHKIFHAHPDMNPLAMKDGNILVQYNEPVVNIVLSEFVTRHWAEIDRKHQDALATSEVLITSAGQNKFDEFGKKALYGRCFMFMDAQGPEVVRVVRASAV